MKKVLQEIFMFVLCYGICLFIKLAFNSFNFEMNLLLESLIIAIIAFILSKVYDYSMKKKRNGAYKK